MIYKNKENIWLIHLQNKSFLQEIFQHYWWKILYFYEEELQINIYYLKIDFPLIYNSLNFIKENQWI